jgi:cytochrome c oxidase assembly factor CtaG
MLGRWSIDPPLGYVAVGYVAVSAVLYLLGSRSRGTPLRRDPLRAASFFAGLAVIVIALDSPIDHYADNLFWVHMIQHILLLTIAPPLILLGRPWPRMWRALPLRARTEIGHAIARSAVAAPLRALARPVPAWIAFNVIFIGWHFPGAYNATLTSNVIHQLEHALFFFSGLLFWARVIDPGPLRPRLIWPVRVAYVAGAMVVGWVLAVMLALAPHPWYAHYASLAHRPGGLSALGDQQIAAGIMWVPGSLAYTVALLMALYRWLEPDTAAQPRRAAATT